MKDLITPQCCAAPCFVDRLLAEIAEEKRFGTRDKCIDWVQNRKKRKKKCLPEIHHSG